MQGEDVKSKIGGTGFMTKQGDVRKMRSSHVPYYPVAKCLVSCHPGNLTEYLHNYRLVVFWKQLE